MDKSKIGNARQQDDNRIAVLHAFGLGDCCQELGAIFMQAELTPSDYVAEQMEMYRALRGGADTPEAHQWIKACIMQDKATRALQSAIAQGVLQIWRVNEAREVLLAPVELQPDNIRYGVFKSFERPEPDMQGARLWVKRADWARFLSALEAAPQPNHASDKAPKKARKKPGPAPDSDWPDAIAKIHKDCLAAGYLKPLERGQLAAIGTMLLGEMAKKDKHPSDDTARKYAKEVVALLPDKSD